LLETGVSRFFVTGIASFGRGNSADKPFMHKIKHDNLRFKIPVIAFMWRSGFNTSSGYTALSLRPSAKSLENG
jgi:hypothetical protein